jgi:hypothetical protein
VPAIDVDVAPIGLPVTAVDECRAFNWFSGTDEVVDFDECSKFTWYGPASCLHSKQHDGRHPSPQLPDGGLVRRFAEARASWVKPRRLDERDIFKRKTD